MKQRDTIVESLLNFMARSDSVLFVGRARASK